MEKEFRTSDLSLASALVVCGYKLQFLDRLTKKKLEFVFERIESLDEVVQRYWSRNLPLDAQTYSLAQKGVKNRLYEMN